MTSNAFNACDSGCLMQISLQMERGTCNYTFVCFQSMLWVVSDANSSADGAQHMNQRKSWCNVLKAHVLGMLRERKSCGVLHCSAEDWVCVTLKHASI